ncbi:MAG TPA: tetratricopeptide repeat protein, partial [Candidatus Limnocylindria bacterium]|nr:tetratricopeptide repeat protein [Candidatus Limnocylindria bacterium]
NIVSKNELLNAVWEDSFVEESVLTQNIYLLRKLFKDAGLREDLIQTVPRRGYRFAGEVLPGNSEMVIEREVVERTLIADISEDSLRDFRPVTDEPRVLPDNAGSFPRARNLSPVAVAVIIVVTVGLVFYSRGGLFSPQNAGSEPKVIAVLPLRSLSSDVEDKEFALGMIENLAARLGSVDELIVRPTRTSSRLAETEPDPIAIGRKLGSDAVLDGSYQLKDGRIRVIVRLLNTTDGSQIWSGNFDEAESDVFKLQDQLSAQAARQLTDRPTERQRQQLTKRSTEDLEAYKLYNRGRYEWTKRTTDGFNKSIAAFRSAIDRDPNFADAYAGLADSYLLLPEYNIEAPFEAFPKAKAAANRALELDPEQTKPSVTLAYILASFDWDYVQAEREYRAAIEADPNYATGRQWYGEMLYTLQRYDEAEKELAIAATLDPLVPVTLSERAAVFYYSGRLDEALAQYAALKREHPQFPTSYIISAWIYELKGMNDQAFAEELMYQKLAGADEAFLKEAERGYSTGGRVGFLSLVVKRFEDELAGGMFPNYRIAHTYARLRNREKTLETIERCIEARSPNITKIALDHNFDFLRDDPRFQEAVAKLRFPK